MRPLPLCALYMFSSPPKSASTGRSRAPSIKFKANAAVPANAKRTAVLVSDVVAFVNLELSGADTAHKARGTAHKTIMTRTPRLTVGDDIRKVRPSFSRSTAI
jgi:hypothetical protein